MRYIKREAGDHIDVKRGLHMTKKQKDFADKVLEGKNPTQAAFEAYGHKPNQRTTSSVVAYQNLRNEAVVVYLQGEGYDAATRIVELSKTAKNETVKLNANKDILDRANIGVRQGAVAAVQINFQADREEFGGEES